MATISATCYLYILSWLWLCTMTLCGTVLEDLKNLHPPPDFNSTIMTNCLNNPSLRYCSSSPMNFDEIFKYTIVASHLCNESKNPNCIESFPKVDLRNRPNIAPLYLSFEFFWRYCPLTVVSIDVSNNSLKGNFPIDVLHCTQIHALDLSINEFSGDIPIQSFSPLTNLTFLNLSYNCFSESEELSDSQFFKRFNSSSFLHSGALLDHRRFFTLKVVILLVGFPILVILIVIFLAWLCFQRPDFLPRKLQRRRTFTPAILNAATSGFSSRNLVGKSDVVHIYKGVLRDGTQVKIEMYWDEISRERYRKFVEECKVLSELDHKNLVRVLGWCKSRKFRAVITEWTRKENVEMWLLSESAPPPWSHRVKVLMGVVECMQYLQEEWPQVDYDLNTSSVLLTQDLEPLISRFKVVDHNISTTRNICKFGVFMLEVILNRKVQEEFEGDASGFIKYMRRIDPEELQQMIDERMELGETSFHQVKQAVSLGLMCIDQSNSEQPSLAFISNSIARAYKATLVLPSANHTITRSHGGHSRFKGHKI
ncbi:probable serine/threonine-protein kinase At1g01540 [Arachis stenosperma]|uniref:probable serine/threonine-protein kinase At1g01540 n=1 Tax=Arachis stenosperma TaxID=217475 RepID=UPI0025ACB2C2|nr:probable serine/threonine-protein kinase At1g01540 [Arachis stenosperma]